MKGLKALFRIRETYIGIAAAIAFQLIFFTVWMTAYSGVNDRTDNLQIGVLNEDTVFGKEVEQQIKEKLPFRINFYSSLKHAKEALNERKVVMVIQIPETLTESLQTNQEASIHYHINQSNATMTKTIMENVVYQLNGEVNRSVFSLQKNKSSEMLTEELVALPITKELGNSIGESVSTMLGSLKDQPVTAKVTKVNKVDRFAANLVPLMIIISSFAGAMVMIMQHEDAVQKIATMFSKWELFIARQIINIAVAFLLPLLTIGLMEVFHITNQGHFLTIYIFQATLFLAFLLFAQVFVLVFGNLGMVFNILALSLQLVTSGVLVPIVMLPNWYMKLANYLPATYGADGYYTITFGGSSANLQDNIIALVVIIGVTLLLSTLVVAIKRQKEENTFVKEHVS